MFLLTPVILSISVAILVAMVSVAGIVMRRLLRVQLSAHCPRCQYPLLPADELDRCPECGLPEIATRALRSHRKRVLLCWMGVAVVGATVSVLSILGCRSGTWPRALPTATLAWCASWSLDVSVWDELQHRYDEEPLEAYEAQAIGRAICAALGRDGSLGQVAASRAASLVVSVSGNGNDIVVGDKAWREQNAIAVDRYITSKMCEDIVGAYVSEKVSRAG